ncbi:MAG: polyprenyl synthetase family protein [Acidobacteria bacterium]|nr:polyprenyl synthetase family protein [Acidobacteriota bacterium]
MEDGDARRYGEPTLHASHGIPAALNAGDYLIGEGYRLLAESEFAPEIRAEMTAIAARGHRTLCLGQGEELAWARNPRPLSSQQVLQIFRQKTAPAFGVALELGAACARAEPEVFDKLRTSCGRTATRSASRTRSATTSTTSSRPRTRRTT